ncbi:hypothetical protein ILUMI_07793 [Ignelater luminosus]|uniref:Uncharacterized protein n=1 Tax=Ignelater luminosus TaxID=2038154 RepID=A0A8K0DCR0_IGNLU|nr:hypothetical protein ILUMI_07793 [Ignelater luminosus]
MEIGRLKYEKPDKYCGKVLIGNWFERQCSFTKDPHDFRTKYMNDYPPKPYSANDPSLIWNEMIKTQGYGPRILFDHQAPHFLENKSTTYDLAFNHIPKLSDGPIPRQLRFRFQRYEPEQDYARNYGNITKFGIQDYYKEKWRCENSDPRTTVTTHYQDTYLPPKKEDLMFRRFAIPVPNSSIMVEANNCFHNLKLRDKAVNTVSEKKLVPYNPYEPRCNPITWECPDKFKEVPNRCFIPRKFK